MKTLKEQVTEIMSGKDSKQTKAISLVKLGITPYEIRLMLGCVSTTKGFNVNTLTFGVEIECYNVRRNDLLQEAERRNIANIRRITTIGTTKNITRLSVTVL